MDKACMHCYEEFALKYAARLGKCKPKEVGEKELKLAIESVEKYIERKKEREAK